jgi:hypothetical protein
MDRKRLTLMQHLWLLATSIGLTWGTFWISQTQTDIGLSFFWFCFSNRFCTWNFTSKALFSEAVNIQLKDTSCLRLFQLPKSFFKLGLCWVMPECMCTSLDIYTCITTDGLKGYAFPSLTTASECNHSQPTAPLVLINVNVTIRICSVLVSNSFSSQTKLPL